MVAGWFREVPAYRVAAFRVVLGATTLASFLPVLTAWLQQAVASPATTATIPWVPHLAPPVVWGLLLVGWAAGVALLVGLWPAASAVYLVILGVYGYALGNHSHNMFLHLLLLALVAGATDRLTLRRLVTGADTDATCPAWPERLLRVQLALVYFHTSIDKVFSPEWGSGGLRLTHLTATRALPGVAALQQWVMATMAAWPGLFSVGVMVGEMLLAVGLLLRPLWPIAIGFNVAFAVSLEFLLAPALFPWDLTALMILFLPAADGGYRVRLSARRESCRVQRRLLLGLDWTRRLTLADEASDRGLCIETPAGRRFGGWRALGLVPVVLPAPFLCLAVFFRFGSALVPSGWLGFGLDDLLFPLLAIWVALLFPAADRGPARVAFEHVAQLSHRALTSLAAVDATKGTGPRHGVGAS